MKKWYEETRSKERYEGCVVDVDSGNDMGKGRREKAKTTRRTRERDGFKPLV